MGVQEALEKKGLAGGKFKLSENFIFCFAKVPVTLATTHDYSRLPTATHYYSPLLTTTHSIHSTHYHSLLTTTYYDSLLTPLTTYYSLLSTTYSDYVYFCFAKVRELLSEGRPARDFEWTNVQVGHGADWGWG